MAVMLPAMVSSPAAAITAEGKTDNKMKIKIETDTIAYRILGLVIIYAEMSFNLRFWSNNNILTL
jgi:hypothetical protein